MRKIAIFLVIGILLAGCATDSQSGGGSEAVQNPQVTIEMESGGKIVLELYPDKAPNTVNNFISLAAQGKYDGVIFHRVISNFMIQGGDFENGDGTGGPGYMIKGEMSANNNEKNDISHVRGVISMARRGGPPGSDHLFYNTAGSQFFIVVEDSEFLDNIYTAFGMVIEGFDTVDKIRDARTDMSDRPLIDQKIKQVTVETFGVEYKDPEIIKE